jgi:predicted small lipoprotein YifL
MAGTLKRKTQYGVSITYCVFLLLAGCGPKPTPTLFIPPSGSNTQPPQATSVAIPTSTELVLDLSQTPIPGSTATAELPSPTPSCTDTLKFLEDITIPDGTKVTPGQSIDKQWRVQNTGTCDWDNRYHLKLVSGDPLGLPAEMALYPARAGAEAIIQMTLTAPQAAGTYHTVWQATNPDGVAFDQPIYVEIIVTTP